MTATRTAAGRNAWHSGPRGHASEDAIKGMRISHFITPLAVALSGAKVLTGRQSPLTHVDVVTVEMASETGEIGFGDTLRDHLPDDVALMIDANQQWDRTCALQVGRIADDIGLAFIEEPLDALDFEGHAMRARVGHSGRHRRDADLAAGGDLAG